jgi:starvation-inducible DNA-binding protein
MKDEKSAPEQGSARKEAPPPRRPAGARTAIDQGQNIQSAEPQQMLNSILADEFVLYVRTLNCHWNVRGMQFHSLHHFRGALPAEAKIIDDPRREGPHRGGTAMATMEEYLGNSRLKERSVSRRSRMMISDLAAGHETVVKHLREAYHTVEERN